MRFRSQLRLLPVIGLFVLLWTSCSALGGRAPSREVVEPLLRQEAENLKREGEEVNPSLGVKITWEIRSVEVREQPQDDDHPWAGTIRYIIESEAPEYDGSTETETFEKAFEYVWDLSTERWIVK